jgi:hypothetical protein
MKMNPKRKGLYRSKSLGVLLKRGHCAPSVMETILKISGAENEGMVKLAGGMPGGIGNTGNECGGITSPLFLLGMRYGLGENIWGLPLVFYKSHRLLKIFIERNSTLFCRDIRGPRERLLPCIKAVLLSPEIYAKTLADDSRDAIAPEPRKAYTLLYAGFAKEGFHCAREVFRLMSPGLPASRELEDGTSAFLGGTAFLGLTCSALSAGIMLMSRQLAVIEDSYPRVFRMIALMLAKRDAFADHVNTFNVTMNIGNRMCEWFSAQFATTQCREITGADFSSVAEVESFLAGGGVAMCRTVAEKVAGKTAEILRQCASPRFSPEDFK